MRTETIIAHLESLPLTGGRIFVGNDVVHLPTFGLSHTPHFINHSYTERELEYCHRFADPILRYASTWAAKEAVYKVVKQVDENIKLWWRGIEILRDKPQGRPTVHIAKLQQPFDISLTISHDGDYVWAIAILMCK